MIAQIIESEAPKGVSVLGQKAKRCYTCGRIKPIEEFYVNKRNKDGRDCYCKTCRKMYRKNHKTEITVELTEKQCAKCRIVKPCSDFYRSKERHDGLHSDCKKCRNAAKVENYAKRLARTGKTNRNGIIINTDEQVDHIIREMAELQLNINVEVNACKKRVSHFIQESARVLEPLRRRQQKLRIAIESFYMRTKTLSQFHSQSYRFGTIRIFRNELEIILDVRQAEKSQGMP